MANEKRYYFMLKHSQVRELQRALLYHIDSVMEPYLEKKSHERDYAPVEEFARRMDVLKRVLADLNIEAGPFTEDYHV